MRSANAGAAAAASRHCGCKAVGQAFYQPCQKVTLQLQFITRFFLVLRRAYGAPFLMVISC